MRTVTDASVGMDLVWLITCHPKLCSKSSTKNLIAGEKENINSLQKSRVWEFSVITYFFLRIIHHNFDIYVNHSLMSSE